MKISISVGGYIRGKAERRGRNVEMAEQAVVESKSFTETEALELGLIDLVARDVPDLIAQLEGREVTRFDGTTVVLNLEGEEPVDVRMDWRQAILSTIARPEILFLLLLGALGNLVHPLFWIPFVPFACVFVPLWWHILKMPGAGAAG